MMDWVSKGIPAAGLYAGPTAWLIDTQANYALVPWVCANQIQVVPVLAVAMAAVSLFGGYLSWRSYAGVPALPASDTAKGGRPHRFVALIGLAMALLFAVIILLHGAAGMVFHGCER
jgi:hypothetical protein